MFLNGYIHVLQTDNMVPTWMNFVTQDRSLLLQIQNMAKENNITYRVYYLYKNLCSYLHKSDQLAFEWLGLSFRLKR